MISGIVIVLLGEALVLQLEDGGLNIVGMLLLTSIIKGVQLNSMEHGTVYHLLK